MAIALPETPAAPVARAAEVAQKRVKATQKGFHVGPREAGDEFYVPATLNAKWFYEVKPAQPVAAPAKGKLAESDLA